MIGLTGSSADELWLQARGRFIDGSPSNVSGRGSETKELRPVVLELTSPRNRWVFSRTPALNPAAVLSEVIWILRGRNDSRFVNFWNNKLKEYAGDGETYHGAYGHRLRHGFGVDQLEAAAVALEQNPDSRQVCLTIWDPRKDLPDEQGKPRAPDIPCNVVSLLKVREERLEWTQIMRSNDFWLGLPFNIVQFTMLQEILAGWIGIEVGRYHHLSDSLHLYPEHESPMSSVSPIAGQPNNDDFAAVGKARSDQLISDIAQRLDRVVDSKPSEGDWKRLAPPAEWPLAYSNMLRVLLADAARRYESPEIAEGLMNGCTNPSISLLWTRWSARVAS